MYSSKLLNSKYMEFVGYDIRDKWIWTSGKGFKNTNIISKRGIPNNDMKMISPSGT